jgi:hypothetical protein
VVGGESFSMDRGRRSERRTTFLRKWSRNDVPLASALDPLENSIGRFDRSMAHPGKIEAARALQTAKEAAMTEIRF